MKRFAFGASSLLALALIACGANDAESSGETNDTLSTVNCPKSIAGWAVGVHYNVGDLVTFKGQVFRAIQAHTPVDGWFPDIVPALWQPVTCAGGAPAAAPPPATAKPPATTAPPPAQTSAPPPPANTGGNGATCVGGPKFDPAGAKNVGNGHGVQFIGGQCLSAADCQSGCCALPCGICSGPGAQFQAGKQGCGFVAH